ncbi:hypothetical protein WDZ92_05060 [Nostoc sp. NIES-2111]
MTFRPPLAIANFAHRLTKYIEISIVFTQQVLLSSCLYKLQLRGEFIE